jgi:hypothetical protein
MLGNDRTMLAADRKNCHAAKAMSLIGRLYDIEVDMWMQLRQIVLTHAGRSEHRFFRSLTVAVSDRSRHHPEGRARTGGSYAIKNLDGLEVYLSDPWVPIDSNRVERQIRSFAVGRKN